MKKRFPLKLLFMLLLFLLPSVSFAHQIDKPGKVSPMSLTSHHDFGSAQLMVVVPAEVYQHGSFRQINRAFEPNLLLVTTLGQSNTQLKDVMIKVLADNHWPKTAVSYHFTGKLLVKIDKKKEAALKEELAQAGFERYKASGSVVYYFRRLDERGSNAVYP